MFRVGYALIVDAFGYFLYSRHSRTVGYQSPINHFIVKVINNFTVFIPPGKVVLTDTFTAKFPLTFIHNGLKEILFIGKRCHISIHFLCMERRGKSTATHTLQSFLRILTGTVKFIHGFGIHQQYVGKAHTHIVDTSVGSAACAQRRLHIEFRPFGCPHTGNTHIIFLIQILIVFIRRTSHIATQIVLIERKDISAAESDVITGTSVFMDTLGNGNTDIISKTAAYTFQHGNCKNNIIIIGGFPVTFVHPQVFKTLFQIVLAFFDNLAQIGNGNLIIVLEIISTLHIAYIRRIIFIGT